MAHYIGFGPPMVAAAHGFVKINPKIRPKNLSLEKIK